MIHFLFKYCVDVKVMGGEKPWWFLCLKKKRKKSLAELTELMKEMGRNVCPSGMNISKM